MDTFVKTGRYYINVANIQAIVDNEQEIEVLFIGDPPLRLNRADGTLLIDWIKQHQLQEAPSHQELAR